MHTVILAHVSFSIAYVVIVVMARLRTVDGQLEEAALDLGANEWQAFRYVTLPAILPGVIAAALLAFTVSFDDYVITSMVAGVDSETLPMVIYAIARRGVNPVVNAISALIVVAIRSAHSGVGEAARKMNRRYFLMGAAGLTAFSAATAGHASTSSIGPTTSRPILFRNSKPSSESGCVTASTKVMRRCWRA
jgi:ABC-type Fe3+ transport system permease subunit